MIRTRIDVLGTGAGLLERDKESSCYVINQELMVDLGWCGVTRMPAHGIAPSRIKALIITHTHADHILGLPQFLFFRYLGIARPEESPLEIVGPRGTVEPIVESALAFVKTASRKDAFPITVRPLSPGESWETSSFRLETCKMIHPVPGLCLRLTDLKSGAVIAFSGDTSYNPDLVRISRGADVLIHEATLGAKMPSDDKDGHSGGEEAARVAKEAGVGQLLLSHMPRARRLPALTGAQRHFPAVALLEDGDTIEVVHGFQGGDSVTTG